MDDKPRARIEAAGRRMGWAVHLGGWQMFRGVTLTRGPQVIRVDLDTRNRIVRGVLESAGAVVERVHPTEKDKVRRIISFIERAGK
ncbi:MULTISPECIES: hypothetical protein [Nocardia]|uniref:hypothetical protein n=1 Tax=Nocardia TaxID=1817 RepID=UPI0007A47B71|nr:MULTISPECIES: hypothetical protein [Nocardia]